MEEGRLLASLSLKQEAPTAALEHHEHLELPSLPDRQDFSEVYESHAALATAKATAKTSNKNCILLEERRVWVRNRIEF
jgi:hypothetical protein